MALSFYNSLSKKKENFIPIEDDSVRLYTCGPTVYDVAHIGNFRTFIFEDLLKRFLMFKDYSVTHVMVRYVMSFCVIYALSVMLCNVTLCL